MGVNKFNLLTKYHDVTSFLCSVVESADQNRNALGFYPASVFEEFARSEQLYVIAERRGNKAKYAGHLLFDCRYPKASILQIFVIPSNRGSGVAAMLLDRLKLTLTEKGFISIGARVAEDLEEANTFWERQGFYVQRVTPGGNTRKRTILVRCHELASPQLFPSSSLSQGNPLGLDITIDVETPLFLLDLNVLFDLGPRRIRHEDALDLFRAERMGQCRFAISKELSEELKRTATSGRTDPMQFYPMIFPTFPYFDSEEWQNLFIELALLVFPEKPLIELSDNDKSDLRHLETAIQHRLAGFITNDIAILNASAEINARYGIQVISPTVFKVKQTVSLGIIEKSFETVSTNTLTVTQIDETSEHAVRELLRKLNISTSSIASDWAAVDAGKGVSVRYGVWSVGYLIGYMTCPTWNRGGSVVAQIAIDESSAHSVNAARALLNALLEYVLAVGPTKICIKFPSQQSCLREEASYLGFRGTANRNELSKLILGCIVTSKNWVQCRDVLNSVGAVSLPDVPPTFRFCTQHIQVGTPDGNRVHVTLESLETLLAPALFCFPGRAAVITPVKRCFAEHLLGHSRQRMLLPQVRSALFNEKHYLSSPSTLKHFNRGVLILFYESLKHGGIGAVVAIARVKRAYLKPIESLQSKDLDPSVLDATNVAAIGSSKMKTITVFDNVIHLPNPVPMKVLKEIGCGNPTKLLTTRPITDGQLQVILSVGTYRG